MKHRINIYLVVESRDITTARAMRDFITGMITGRIVTADIKVHADPELTNEEVQELGVKRLTDLFRGYYT